MDPCDYGYEKREGGVSLTPTMLTDGVVVAPERLLQITRCNCRQPLATVHFKNVLMRNAPEKSTKSEKIRAFEP